jgi:hypothetical protein
LQSNTSSVAYRLGTAYPSTVTEFTPRFTNELSYCGRINSKPRGELSYCGRVSSKPRGELSYCGRVSSKLRDELSYCGRISRLTLPQ